MLELGTAEPVVTARVDRFIAEHGKAPLPEYGVSRFTILPGSAKWEKHLSTKRGRRNAVLSALITEDPGLRMSVEPT